MVWQSFWESWDWSDQYGYYTVPTYSGFLINEVESSIVPRCFDTNNGIPCSMLVTALSTHSVLDASIRDVIDLSSNPLCVILDIGCTRSMGSRRAWGLCWSCLVVWHNMWMETLLDKNVFCQFWFMLVGMVRCCLVTYWTSHLHDHWRTRRRRHSHLIVITTNDESRIWH